MGKSLTDIAKDLRDDNKRVHLIYAFNGTGKTRLSREFKSLMASPEDSDIEVEISEMGMKKILYYNAFTEDLFYWDNDLKNDIEPRLRIYPNSFTKWIFEEQGQERNVIDNFHNYVDEKLTPRFNEAYRIPDNYEGEITIEAFTEVTFSYERGNEEPSTHIKISKGEESNFIWCVFYTLLQQIIEVLNAVEPDYQEPTQFDDLEYVFIDDPVSSLDDAHLIRLAVDLAELIKSNPPNLKFIITTHNPLFYNVLWNEFNNNDRKTGYNKDKHFKKYRLDKNDDGIYNLENQKDSPFSYHLFLINEIDKAIVSKQVHKYHFSFLRNILEKMSTFLGYDDWKELLSPIEGSSEAYYNRILNLSSHSKHSGEEIVELKPEDKMVLERLINDIKTLYRFKSVKEGSNE